MLTLSAVALLGVTACGKSEQKADTEGSVPAQIVEEVDEEITVTEDSVPATEEVAEAVIPTEEQTDGTKEEVKESAKGSDEASKSKKESKENKEKSSKKADKADKADE